MINPLKKKKKGGKGKWAVGGACVAAAALLGLGFDVGGLGSGMGFPTFDIANESNGSSNGSYTSTPEIPIEVQNQEEVTNTPDGTGEEVPLLIRISGDTIVHDGQTVSINELREIVLRRSRPDDIWEVRDERGIAIVHEEVLMMLRDNEITFTETSG